MLHKLIKIEGEYYLYKNRLAKDGEICIVIHNRLFYAYSSKDPGDGLADIVLASTKQIKTAHKDGKKNLPLLDRDKIESAFAKIQAKEMFKKIGGLTNEQLDENLKESTMTRIGFSQYVSGYSQHAFDNKEKRFTLTQLKAAIALAWSHQQIRLTCDPQLCGKQEEFSAECIPVIAGIYEDDKKWKVDVEMIEWDTNELLQSGHSVRDLPVEFKLDNGYVNILEITTE